MKNDIEESSFSSTPESNPPLYSEFIPKAPKNKPGTKEIIRHLILFLLTCTTVTFVSTFLVGKDLAEMDLIAGLIPLPTTGDILRGATFAGLLLSFLTFHEFGHYFAAVFHKVAVSLPYYIPIPLGIGTLGAVIRIREPIKRTKALFDIGIAGPLAGFVVSLIVLFIGFLTLPEPEFLNEFGDHTYMVEHFNQYGEYPEAPKLVDGQMAFFFGKTILFNFFASLVDGAPPMWEIMHYPFLLAGWFGLFFTALNLMPVGQLDGGHILYSLIGYKKHKIVARIFFIGISFLASFEAVPIIQGMLSEYITNYLALSWSVWTLFMFLILNKAFHKERLWVLAGIVVSVIGAMGWLFFVAQETETQSSLIWLFWVIFITLFVKVEHPPVLIEEPLTPGRKVLGWLSMLIFVLCISFNPIVIQ